MGLFDKLFKSKKAIKDSTLSTFTDPQFGEFLLIEDLCWFEGTIIAQKKEIAVTLETKESVETLRNIYTDIEQFIEKASHYAAEVLLESSNVYGYDAWANDIIDENDLPHMTEDEFNAWLNKNLPHKKYLSLNIDDFIKRISLLSIHISECSAYLLIFDDGDLFWGHQISVDGNIESGFTNASM